MHHLINVSKKIDGTRIHGAADLELVTPVYKLIEYSSNYSETTGSLRFYSKDETTNFNAGIANTNNLKSFKYKAKVLGKTEANPALNNANRILKIATTFVPLMIIKTWIILFLLSKTQSSMFQF